jgi:hypothetical protein
MANVAARRCRGIHYTVLGFYHCLLGLSTYGLFVLYRAAEEGKGFDYSARVYLMMTVAGIFDWQAYNARNLAF